MGGGEHGGVHGDDARERHGGVLQRAGVLGVVGRGEPAAGEDAGGGAAGDAAESGGGYELDRGVHSGAVCGVCVQCE